MNSYIHIPFCRQKCPYCKFALTPIFDSAKKRRYIAHLKDEIENSPKKDTSTIYFGGGTPSVLTREEVSSILECFSLEKEREISFESNPEDITIDYTCGLLDLGINRLSLGVQSLNNETLKAIHRSDRKSIFSALDAIEWSISNSIAQISLNIDFIIGLPFSKTGETLSNIRELHERYPDITHTSIYMLESGLYPEEWMDTSITEEEIAAEYEQICAYFDSLGWHHYEISNWSKPGYECRHNQGYWDHSDSRGYGLSATSYIEGRRWENSHSFAGYYRGERTDEEVLTEEQSDLEKIIFGIRTFSLDASLFATERVGELIQEKYITLHAGKIVLTPTGILAENTIISRLIE